MMVKYLNGAGIFLTASVVISSLLLSGPVIANSGYETYKVEMSRIDPNKPIRKSAIMSTIKEKFPGRILSIRENRDGGDDCHIVKSMGEDGEFRIIHVACTK